MENVTTRDVLACSFSAWHSIPALKENSMTPKAASFKIGAEEENDFREWMAQEGLFLPLDGLEKATEDESEVEEDEDVPKQYHFPQLHAFILAYLKRFPSGVFPKLNWSSPKDASWIHPTSAFLRCTTPAEIYQLLKASDNIVRDLDYAFDGCVDGEPEGYDVELVLKVWKEVQPSQEWRCFVIDGRFVAASHRDRDLNFYPFLQDPSVIDTIRNLLLDFFNSIVAPNFPLTSYAFDVVLSSNQSKAYILDISPLKHSTDPLLYTWDELISLSSTPPASAPSFPNLRVVDERLKKVAEEEVTATRYTLNRYPREVAEMALGGGGSVEEMVRRMRELDTE
ncbi:D123-domain-containing protein [Atractiella rhizophila]|nr:D123-domain-containing protein [Atractiella rhizophila]